MSQETVNAERANRLALLLEHMKRRILVFDGAMGTTLLGVTLSHEDWGGEEFEGCHEILTHTRPDVVLDVHRQFLEAGADLIETNTFGSTPLVLDEYNLGSRARELSRESAVLALKAAREYDHASKPRWVVGSMGPTTKAISVTGGITFDELLMHYREQALGLIEGGADLLLVETCQDTLNLKAALLAISDARGMLRQDVPVMASGTIEPMGTMLAGQTTEALYTSLDQRDLFSIGLNCATGPRFMTDHLRTLSEIARFPISCIPNAGLPDEDGNYNESPEAIAEVLGNFAQNGWVNFVGGCCGTTPAYTREIAKAVAPHKPRSARGPVRSRVSGIDYLSITDDKRPVIVGERTNVIGSRKFKRLIHEEAFEEAAEIGRKQVRGGAHIVDVCLADPDRDEMQDMVRFLDRLTKKVKVPLMIDSTDPVVIHEALKRCQGKAIINSINLEDGEERFAEVVPLALRFGAAFVVGCIDEDPQQGMAVTRQRKLEVAVRSHDLLTKKYGVPAEDIYFDPLVFPCATGDEAYIGSAVETIEGLRLIKEALPACKTVLGISNVSFGLPNAGREVLNSVFLYLNVKAGLDLAIVNSEKLVRFASIAEEERVLAEDLLYNRGEEPIAAFAAFYRDKRPARSELEKDDRPLGQRLSDYIIEGTRDGLTKDLDEALKHRTPLEVINGPLMAGMDEVGRLFNNNELIVAEVLQSAEAMKAAVAHLEPLMEKSAASSRGKVVLATVKGDVHDIGKNLVEIILSNNGYEIINLGIKIPPQELIAAHEAHRPDIIGLSGLLVKSAQQMIATAEDLNGAGVEVPILVGGAALTRKFTETRIAPKYDGPVLYATDAMDGLSLANQLMQPDQREAVLESRAQRVEAPASAVSPPKITVARAVNWEAVDIPTPPDLKTHRVSDVGLEDIFPYVNPAMLYGKHLGLRGSFPKLLDAGDAKALELKQLIGELEDEALGNGWMTPKGVFSFFRAHSDGNYVVLRDSGLRFDFPRQADGDMLCLADWVAPAEHEDYLASFVVTCGSGVREAAEAFKASGEYLKSHAIQALAIECAEAFAELLHQRIRTMWGIPDPGGLSTREIFQAKYRGLRVSFGYPACPRLEDQDTLWRLLNPEANADVVLTEGYMMEPEASVSAVVFHHPAAKYFSVRDSVVEA